MVKYHLSRKEDQVGVCVWHRSGNAYRRRKQLLWQAPMCYIVCYFSEHMHGQGSVAQKSKYILWRYEKLGKGNRRMWPSCMVLTIRHIFPADDENYMGFKRA